MPSCASSACALSTIDRARDVVRGLLGQLVLRVERALAERDDVRARRCAIRARERVDLGVEPVGGDDAIDEPPLERGRARRSSRR